MNLRSGAFCTILLFFSRNAGVKTASLWWAGSRIERVKTLVPFLKFDADPYVTPRW